jgi:beta-barrel assembly-enhancing protease
VKLLINILLTLTFTAQNVTAGTMHNLPDMGDSAGGVVTPEFERRLGQAIMRQVRQSADVMTDPEVESYIQSIGYQLVANSDDNQIPFIFFVIDNSVVNAFAAPGGVVGINSGIILNSDSESELAGVLAHEIAHVTQRHMARTFEAASKFSLPMMAAMVGAIVLGALNPEAGQAAIAAVSGLSAQYQINFTRANEEEADRIGMQLLARSDFDPFGMPGFFQKLLQSSRYYRSNAPEYLLTHPLTTSRIAESIARAEQYPPKKYQSSASYKLIRARLKANSFESPKEAVKFFESSLQTGGYPDMESARYGYLIALTRANDFARAREQLGLLLKDDEENVTYLLAAARLESAQRNYSSAVGIYQEAHKLYPDYWPVVHGYTRALLDAKQPSRARELIRNYGRNHEPSLPYYDLLSQAEAEAGSPAEAGIAKAEYYYLIGGTQLAIDRLKFAQQQTELNYYQMERIKARLAQLEYELALERELKLAPEG